MSPDVWLPGTSNRSDMLPPRLSTGNILVERTLSSSLTQSFVMTPGDVVNTVPCTISLYHWNPLPVNLLLHADTPTKMTRGIPPDDASIYWGSVPSVPKTEHT